jgi:hypothetical protein
LVLDISAETGLIDKVEEYYTKLWHQSVDVDRYRGQPAVGEKKRWRDGTFDAVVAGG